MKSKRTKNDFSRAAKRSTHKRKARQNYIEGILSEINKTGVKYDSLKVTGGNDTRIFRSRRDTKREEKVTRGVFSSSKSGFGFVKSDDYERDIFIPEGNTLGAISGDIVEIKFHTYIDRFDEERTEGRVIRIAEYGRKNMIGTVAYKKERIHRKTVFSAYLIPDDQRISISPYISELSGAKEGDKVEIILDRSKLSSEISGRVVKNFGDTYSKDANYEAVLAESEIPIEFSKEELSEAEFFAAIPINADGRVDRRKDIIFTIDSESAKDLDDAISIKRLAGGGYQLGVHIADVSYYVRERTHLDRAVMARGTSVYFADKVVPMLPKCLSNGACSLNPGEDRYALSAIVSVDSQGEIKNTKIEKSIIKSRIKGIYKEINSLLENKANPDTVSKYKPFMPTLNKMMELYLILKRRSFERGALELEGSECKMLFDEGGNLTDIVKNERGESEKMIEQFMLLANEAVARALSEKGIPCVYRIHENPPKEKLFGFASFAQNLGLNVSKILRDGADAKDYSDLLSEGKEQGIGLPLSYSMLRSMAKAKYSEKRSFHFGLGLEYYCHFTSPIRRLSDLATHRIIHKVLFENKRAEIYAPYAKRAAAAATDAEIRAISAERRIENLYKVIYMSDNIGREYDAIITSVTSFGFFAELENTVEGLVPISELYGVFTYEENMHRLRSRDITYKLGDRVRIKVLEADIIRGKLLFGIAEEI